MNPFELVVVIVTLAFLYKLIDTWLRRGAKDQRRADQAAESELLRRLQDVEERVRVLERIVTDERYELKQQFKDLGG